MGVSVLSVRGIYDRGTGYASKQCHVGLIDILERYLFLILIMEGAFNFPMCAACQLLTPPVIVSGSCQKPALVLWMEA